MGWGLHKDKRLFRAIALLTSLIFLVNNFSFATEIRESHTLSPFTKFQTLPDIEETDSGFNITESSQKIDEIDEIFERSVSKYFA